jgi:hypothetical protein
VQAPGGEKKLAGCAVGLIVTPGGRAGQGVSITVALEALRWLWMVDPLRSQADSDGVVFGYLGVRISEGSVWTSKHGDASRYLGPLAGACAGLDEPRRSRIASFISSVLTSSSAPKDARLYVAFADGSSLAVLITIRP